MFCYHLPKNDCDYPVLAEARPLMCTYMLSAVGPCILGKLFLYKMP